MASAMIGKTIGVRIHNTINEKSRSKISSLTAHFKTKKKKRRSWK
jgi:hypothetical protein